MVGHKGDRGDPGSIRQARGKSSAYGTSRSFVEEFAKKNTVALDFNGKDVVHCPCHRAPIVDDDNARWGQGCQTAATATFPHAFARGKTGGRLGRGPF